MILNLHRRVAAAAAAAAAAAVVQKSNILEKPVSLLENTTNYYRICFNEVMGFLKMSTSSHARLAAKTYLGDGEFLQVTENMQVIKL
jgi:hypothetical protein